MAATDWIEEFLPLYEKARPLVQEVGKSVREAQEENIILALKGTKANMPTILNAMKAIQSPKEKELREIRKIFEKGLKEFAESCDYGIKYFDKPNVFNHTVWIEVAKTAAKKMEEATTRFSQYVDQ